VKWEKDWSNVGGNRGGEWVKWEKDWSNVGGNSGGEWVRWEKEWWERGEVGERMVGTG
jgi:hypothetical protein